MADRKNRIALKKYKGVYYRESTSNIWKGRPDKCYWVLFTDPLTGKKQWEKCGWISEGWTPNAAQLRRSELLEQDRAGDYKPKIKRRKDNLTFGEFADKYIEWAKNSKKSWRDDEQRYRTHLKPSLGSLRLKGISSFHLEKLKRDLQKKKAIKVKTGRNNTMVEQANCLSPATVKHCLVLVRQMYNKAIAWGLYDGVNPVKKVKLPTVNNRRIRFLNHDEANMLLQELSKQSPGLHDQALISMQCGLRFGEIANLTGSDLNFTNGVIHIRDPKGASRDAYMTDDVKEILTQRNPENPTDYVFPDNKGNRRKEVSTTFQRTVESLGFNRGIVDRKDKLVFHSLRHTFGSWLAQQGTPILTIKELMGHKSIEMTMRYAHLIPDQKIDAVKELASRFNSAKSKNVVKNKLKIKKKDAVG